ncbi:GTP-binding protein [Actibacterium sp. MT2.3-13A]|uniref:CobW family GTP-binding protein n=1 Tax=Actibacterium sp. MT2.3-13A TaxID=2828332 RepID=UPI001BAC7668|nr:GTP-binding protein [Actibacterium sp. MT2.3-13A]
MIPVNIITGFLGSGKTTLLREILSRPEFSDTAVIVNEFGEVGLDHILLEEVEEGVLLMDSGCLCCTIRSDLKDTLRDLHDRAARGDIPRFRRVVVETTGLADPAPIVSTIAAEPVIRNHYRIGNIICTVEAVAGAQTLAGQPEAVKQASVADRILITKCDLSDAPEIAALEARLHALNPVAAVVRSEGRDFDADFLFAEDLGDAERRAAEVARWLESAARAPAHDHLHDSDTNSFVIVYPQPIDWTAFGVWLTALLHVHGAHVLRVKGILNVQDSDTPVVIHGVQHVVHPPLHLHRWPDEDRTSRIIFITRGIGEGAIRHSLTTFLAAVAPAGGGEAAA